MQLFPIEMMAGLREKDIIETIRISPRDAQKGFSRSGFSDKVAGDALYHFAGSSSAPGAPMTSSGAARWALPACGVLPAARSAAAIGQEPTLRARIRQRLAGDLDPARLFPPGAPRKTTCARGWPRSAPMMRRYEKRPCTRHPAPIAWRCLLKPRKLEVLYEELPNVVTDALEEQATWNVFKVKDRDQPPGHNGQQAPQGTVPVSMALMPPAGISGHPVDRSIPWSPSRRRRASPRM